MDSNLALEMPRGLEGEIILFRTPFSRRSETMRNLRDWNEMNRCMNCLVWYKLSSRLELIGRDTSRAGTFGHRDSGEILAPGTCYWSSRSTCQAYEILLGFQSGLGTQSTVS